jgi:adenylate kinase family enzyme
VRRVSVVGNAGSGKTTLGRALADRLGVSFVELDSVFHQPGWRPLPVDEFRRRVEELVAGDGWVMDGNYSAVRDLVWARADTVVWLDLPRRTVMWQVVSRTLRRTLTRVELWNGNREPLAGLFRLDPERSIIRWAWLKHDVYSDRFAAAARDPAFGHLSFVRVGSRRDAAALIAEFDPRNRA